MNQAATRFLRRTGLPALSFALPLGLYVVTACRDIFWMDSTELMLAGRFLTLPHPPGYPLLTLIVRLVSLVPVGEMAFRLNLVSAFAAAASCLVVFLLLRAWTDDDLSSLLGSLFWGTSFELWQQATVLEVYSLHALLVALILYALTLWIQTEQRQHLLLAAFLFGLALTNHLTVSLWVPALLVLLTAGPWRAVRPAWILSAAGLALLPLALYLYLPMRSASNLLTCWGGSDTIAGMWDTLTGRLYRYRVLAGGLQYVQTQVKSLPWLFGKQFLVAWLLVIPGLVAAWRKNRGAALALAIAPVIVAGAALAYNIPDKEGYLLPAYLALLLIVGLGLAALRRTRARTWVTLAGLAALVLPLLLFWRDQDRSRLHGLRDLSRAVLAELPENTILFTDDYSIFQGMRWIQAEKGLNPKALVVSEYSLAFPWYLHTLESWGRPLAVPEAALRLAERTWLDRELPKGAAFGEMMSGRIQDLKYLLISDWIGEHRVFWVPRNFEEWPESWRGYRLVLHGLTYELVTDAQKPDPKPAQPALPSPELYRTTSFRDADAQNVCRRFAAAVNRRGILRFSSNDAASAIADFELALRYYPDYPGAVENKGLVFASTGRPDSARVYLNLFLSLSPNSSETQKVTEVLRQLNR